MTPKPIRRAAAMTGLVAGAVGVGLVLALPAEEAGATPGGVPAQQTKVTCVERGDTDVCEGPGGRFTVTWPPTTTSQETP